jgi:uroporphyrinogen-III decarboxylase
LNARAVAAYLHEQIAAGADAVMLFDTWGGLLTTDAYRSFSLASMRSVIAALRPAPDGRRIPTIVFTKGGGQWLDAIADCGADCVGLDWTVDLADARRRVGASVALQGNLDPLVLLTDVAVVARRPPPWFVRRTRAGHAFNPAVDAATPLKAVAAWWRLAPAVRAGRAGAILVGPREVAASQPLDAGADCRNQCTPAMHRDRHFAVLRASSGLIGMPFSTD